MEMSERSSLNCLAKSTPQRIRECDSRTLQTVKDLLEQALRLPQPKASARTKRPKRRRKCQSESPDLHRFELVLSFPSQGQPVPPIGSLSKELYHQFVKSYESVADFLQRGPEALQLGVAASPGEAILGDIQRFRSPKIGYWRGPFALLAFRRMYEQSESSASAIAEANWPTQWQAVRHAITDGRKLKLIVDRGGQGMIPLLTCHYNKWRDLPSEDVANFIDCCKNDEKLGGLIQTFESNIDHYQTTYELSLSPNGLPADLSLWTAQFTQGIAGSQDLGNWVTDYQGNVSVANNVPNQGWFSHGIPGAGTFTEAARPNCPSYSFTT
jgi:hypothetical protein